MIGRAARAGRVVVPVLGSLLGCAVALLAADGGWTLLAVAALAALLTSLAVGSAPAPGVPRQQRMARCSAAWARSGIRLHDLSRPGRRRPRAPDGPLLEACA